MAKHKTIYKDNHKANHKNESVDNTRAYHKGSHKDSHKGNDKGSDNHYQMGRGMLIQIILSQPLYPLGYIGGWGVLYLLH